MARGGGTNGWSDIQRELLEEILRKLTLVDFLKCRRVCRSWRRTVDDAVATKGTCPHASQFPFLMLLPSNLFINKPATFSATLSDITQEEDTSYTIPTQKCNFDFDVFRVLSVQGWLVFQKIYCNKNQNHALLLLFSNPVSGEEFELPHLPLFSGQDLSPVHTSVKLVFSSAPPYSSDFLVVACVTVTFQLRGEGGYRWMQQLAFCKVTDKSWTLIPIPTDDESPPFPFHEFAVLDWKLYAMNMFLSQSGSVTVFNLRDSTFVKLEQEPIQKQGGAFVEGMDWSEFIVNTETCMLTRDGDHEILLVLHRKRSNETIGFRVFKLENMGDTRTRWIEVGDLGDRVLLMDYTGIQVISIKEINLPEKLNGGNCVFFCITKVDLGVFFFKDKRITRSLQVGGSRFLWFMPSLW
ncbi:putative F-box protein At4g22660 [Lotus japonicus]|uniref:putative F-box protein At4g22660 n=1 Tax=Lotus japonicus TaxID=34305 RepID=UPI0025840E8C|nr:putative F-box protein At4g22660 [Lotus japonicus]